MYTTLGTTLKEFNFNLVNTAVCWTPNYGVSGHIAIPTWTAVAGDVIGLTVQWDGNTSSDHYMLDHSTPNTFVRINSLGQLEFSSNMTVQVDGVDIPSGTPVPADTELVIVATFTGAGAVSRFGSNSAGSNLFTGFMYRIVLNSATENRFYESLLVAVDRPNTLVLTDAISGQDGTITGFPLGLEWIRSPVCPTSGTVAYTTEYSEEYVK